MKSRKLFFLGVITISATLISLQLAAQNLQPNNHHHYKLIDVGTFGGPGGAIAGFSWHSLNQRGSLVGMSDTSTPDPFAPDCFDDCYVDVGFLVQDDVVIRQEPPPGGAGLSSFGYAINDAGQVVGQAQNGAVDPATGWPETHAVLWQSGRTIAIDLGTLGGTQSVANALNDQGQVVGAAMTATPDPFANTPISTGCETPGTYGFTPSTFAGCTIFFPGTTEIHAFVWTQNGGMRDLHTLGGPDSNAFVNNARGEVAGWSFTSFDANPTTGVPTMDPFYWSPWDGTMTDLGGLGGTLGGVVAINNRGQIAGVSNTPNDVTTHPFIWSKSKGMQDLFLHGGLGGTFGNSTWLNDAGQVVGLATLPGDEVGHAFLWQEGTMIDLGTLGTDPLSVSSSINSQGQVVGGTFTTTGVDLRGFLWEDGGPIVDLNTLIVPASSMYVTAALLINDRGDIGCLGMDPGDTEEHACLLIPCDENHRGIEGCDYSLVDATTAAQVPPPPPLREAQFSVKSENNDRPGGWRDRLDGRLAHHHNFSGTPSPNN